MNIEFSNKTVIVTGAAHGFGRTIALAFAERGANVWACDILTKELAETEKMSKDSTGNCEVRTVDVSDYKAACSFSEEVREKSGSIHILVNNAGGVLGQIGRPLEDISPRDWAAIFEVNVTGAFYFTQAVAPAMKAARYGRIINISSGAGLGVSLTGIQAYASAKAAQIGLTRQIAHELGPWGITVNNIAPGFIRSNPMSERQWESYGKDGQKKLVESLALRRLGKPEDIASGVLFLASDYANWITGQVLPINGGKL